MFFSPQYSFSVTKSFFCGCIILQWKKLLIRSQLIWHFLHYSLAIFLIQKGWLHFWISCRWYQHVFRKTFPNISWRCFHTSVWFLSFVFWRENTEVGRVPSYRVCVFHSMFFRPPVSRSLEIWVKHEKTRLCSSLPIFVLCP